MEKSKKILSITLLIALAIKLLMAPAIFLDYQLRKDFIIKNYCVNKNRPEMHCDGKCYLAKQLKKAQEKEEKQATNDFLTKFFGIEGFTKTVNFKNYFGQITYFSRSEKNYFYLDNAISTDYTSIFHPPRI
ncbi:MAG: hypothetical protein LCH67_16900 [Bacteroidetes bacterium]|jgi:hypothetical protein|nr:hypothetical protein [Bacteroidota bacterium]